MTQASEVRTWARDNGYAVTPKGRLHPDIWKAYSDAHGGIERDTPQRGGVAGCSCGRKWAGLREAHCPRCHRQFSTVTNFDYHIISSRGEHQTRCVDPLTITDKNGKARLRLKQSVWGPIYVLDSEHWKATGRDGIFGENDDDDLPALFPAH